MAAIGYGRNRKTCIYPELDDFIERKGLTLGEFGELVGVTQSYVSKILNGSSMPGREIIEKISQATGLTGIITADGIDFVDLYKPTQAEPEVMCETCRKNKEPESIDIPKEADDAAKMCVDIVKETADAILAEIKERDKKEVEALRISSYPFEDFQEVVASNCCDDISTYSYLFNKEAFNLNNLVHTMNVVKKVDKVALGATIGSLLVALAGICTDSDMDLSEVALIATHTLNGDDMDTVYEQEIS